MNSTDFQNGWPSSRTGAEKDKWHHSDFRAVGYTFTYRLFDAFVDKGDLR